MSEGQQQQQQQQQQESRAERMARYKEERRKQLAAQFAAHSEPTKRTSKDSSSSEGPRTTRTSRLRAAATHENGSSPIQATKVDYLEKSRGGCCESVGNRRVERDKSSKRKSNLNRSLNSEEVPNLDLNDLKSRRRRRRFFPQELFEQKEFSDDRKSDTDVTAQSSHTIVSSSLSSSSSPVTASSRTKKSELSIHMENARRGVTPSYSEIGKYKPLIRRSSTSSPKDKSSPKTNSDDNNQQSDSKLSNKENFVRNRDTTTATTTTTTTTITTSKNIAKKMEELTALTKETLARVERLANKNKDSPNRAQNKKLATSIKQIGKIGQPSSILKKKCLDESGPVSILKRKVSQDDGTSSSTHTPPVTFSPSVVEPSTRRQGILKKRRSLDESQVMRHRSCSPDVANKGDSRSILKNQRRSSLEELTRTQSPELQLHGILKRKTSKTEDGDESLNSPQGILKRRSGTSSAGSTSSTPHVSITTAVILAAAGGAEMVLDEHVKPILKKKSFSDENSLNENSNEIPKPILKKKSSTDTDDCDEKPRPILKLSKSSIEKDTYTVTSDTDCDFKPILKQQPQPRLSFCSDSNNIDAVVIRRPSRRSHTICSDYSSVHIVDKEEKLMKKSRPRSVCELVMSFESSVTSTGAIPKRTSLKRNSDRYRTQPVTSNELEASLNYVKSPHLEEKQPPSSPLNHSINSLLDFTSSLENDNNLNSFLTSTLHNTSPDSVVCGKMSSDSAFQSLGDGLELDDDNKLPAETGKLEPNKLELQMKAIAEEAQKLRLGKVGGFGVQKYKNRRTFGGSTSSSNRFSTQPITYTEVQEATKKNIEGAGDRDDVEPSGLSLLERIRLFNVKVAAEDEPPKRDVPRRRFARFQTQPVTSNEVETARCISPTYALDEQSVDKSERRGILKPSSGASMRRPPSPSAIQTRRSVLKKRDSFDTSPGRRPVFKTVLQDVTHDEGISCNDSASDSEVSLPKIVLDSATTRKKSSKSSSSEGESSGGREIRSIFKNENKLKVKHALESVLSKSKSHTRLGDESRPLGHTTIRRSQTQTAMPRTIAELQAKLQKSGESEWKKRVQHNNNANDELKLLKDKNRYNDELSADKSILSLKKDELDAASQQWKSRVEKSDAEKFSTAGRMDKVGDNLSINIPYASGDKNTKKPQARRFKGKESESLPVSPEKNKIIDLTRSYSVPENDKESSSSDSPTRVLGRKVSIARPDDFTFKNFYKSIEEKRNDEYLDLCLDDFNLVTRQSLLVQKKNIQVQKRRGASRNPIKALASRSDVSNEYTEVITGVAEREKKRLNIEKLAKNSNLAVEALAGLASKEDFTSVALKKSSSPTTLVPFKDIMLLQVKGRRHVQTRLVEPVPESINEGDNFLLITSKCLYNYVGEYANVIEQSRATDILNHIQHSGDLGCKVDNVITINSKNNTSREALNFWTILGGNEGTEVTKAGHPTEDEIYESNILTTNMIYGLGDNELVPLDEYWGSMPKIDMLQPTKVLVFDFGSEMYVWSGKNAPIEKKRRALKLAKELWDEGYNYSDCSVSPLNVASILGNRPEKPLTLKSNNRPEWALFTKITQHRETILFKEKFIDWPDFSRIIRVKDGDDRHSVDSPIDFSPCDATIMQPHKSEPDLIVDNQHLGRGDQYFDEQTSRLFQFDTIKIQAWRILENHSEELDEQSIGHFYDGESYILRWHFRMTVKGRELSGKPSKFAQSGRERVIYLCWQGSNSSINEKGCAALLTVELDNEKAPQIRIQQNNEPAAFLKLFNGSMVVHIGKRNDRQTEKARLFLVKGEIENEICLIEVNCEIKQLRSKTSFVLVDNDNITIWNGCKSTQQKRNVAKLAVRRIIEHKCTEFGFNCDDDDDDDDIVVNEIEEGEEPVEFFGLIGKNRNLYSSLLANLLDFNYTMRLFHLSAVSGNFEATEILCPYRSEYSSPYPFWQTELYSVNQPAIFLIDNNYELWLWQGWWPETEEKIELSDQTGSGAVRWQAERRAAMQTAINYWRKKNMSSGDENVPAYLVWAGLEPLEFQNLFPTWVDQENVAQLNLMDGKKEGAKLLVEKELALLSRTIYPLSELLQRPLPEGVDPTHLEIYLSPEDFQELLSMTREEFQKLPSWKQTAMKKEKGLF